jgi:hypothetical protein
MCFSQKTSRSSPSRARWCRDSCATSDSTGRPDSVCTDLAPDWAHNIVPGQYRERRHVRHGVGFGATLAQEQFANSSIGRLMVDFGKRDRSETNLRRAQAIWEPRPGAVISTATALMMADFERRMNKCRTPSH